MNKRINAAFKPLAAIGLALALAGCGGKTGGAGTVGGASSGGGETLATVDGTTVTRTDLNQILEAQYGAQTLPILIDTQLLVKAAKDAGITISDADINAEVARKKALEPQLAEALTKNPLLLNIFNLQAKRDLVTQRLLTKDVKATDADVQKFFTTYKAYYEEPVKVKVGTLLTSTKARADAMSRAIKSKSKTFEQLVEEQKKAQDPIAARSSVGDSFAPVDTLPLVFGPEEAKAIEKLPKGGTLDPRPINIGQGDPIYVIFHVTDRQEPAKSDFAKLKPEVETDYKMSQVAREEVKKNPKNPPFDETLKTTRDSLRQQSQNPAAPAPTMRDVLTFILQPKQQNLLVDLRAKGTVKVDDPAYSSVAEAFKPVPTPVPATGATAGGATAGGAEAPAPNAAPAPQAPAANAPADATNAAPAAEAPAPNAAPPVP